MLMTFVRRRCKLQLGHVWSRPEERTKRMKDSWEWEEPDIQQLIDDKIEESITLDYKASAALSRTDNKKVTELTKDVSAFANSAGGTIVYGVAEDPSDRRLPGGIDGGVDPKDISREWLEQILNTRIQRRVDG